MIMCFGGGKDAKSDPKFLWRFPNYHSYLRMLSRGGGSVHFLTKPLVQLSLSGREILTFSPSRHRKVS